MEKACDLIFANYLTKFGINGNEMHFLVIDFIV